MTTSRPLALAIAAALLLPACGKAPPAGPADATPPELSLVVHVVNPDGSPGGQHTAGQARGPIAVDAANRLEIMAQGRDPESGPRLVSVKAEASVTCTQPDRTNAAPVAASREVAHSERRELVPAVMAVATGYADELLGLECAAPAIDGTAVVRLQATGTNREGTSGQSAVLELTVSGLRPKAAKAGS